MIGPLAYGAGIGLQAKIIALLVIGLGALLLYAKHQEYLKGVKDERARQIARSAERSIKAVKTVTMAKAEADKLADQGKREIEELKKRHQEILQKQSSIDLDCLKELKICPPNLMLLQP